MYKYIKDKVKGKNLPCTAENKDGETIVIEEGYSDEGEHYYKLTTMQKNQWARINTYYQDGTICEEYDKS